MRTPTYLFILGMLAIACHSCSEDPISPNLEVAVQGVVFDQDTEERLANCRVTIINTFDVTQTDSSGIFSFDSLQFQENYTLRFEKTGYEDQTISVRFSIDGASLREIEVPLELDRTINAPPEIPALVEPENQADEQPTTVTFRWTSSTADVGDDLQYQLYLYSDQNPTGTTYVTTDTFLEVSELSFDTRYFWQVAADDQVNEPTTSTLYSFRTQPFPDFRVHFVRENPANGNFVIYAGETPELGVVNQEDSLSSLALTDGQGSCWRPHLNVLANRVAYLSFVGAEAHIFTMDRDGSNHRQVTNVRSVSSFNLLEVNYAWAPNGGAFMYPHDDKLFVVNENGTGLREFATADNGYSFAEVSWSSQGLIAARMQRADRYQSKIVMYNEEGVAVDTLLDAEAPGRWIGGPVLSEGADFTLFTEDRDAQQYPDERPRRAWILQDGFQGTIRQVNTEAIPPNTSDLMPALPPGGEIVMFVNRPSNNASLGDIYIMEVSNVTGETRSLAYPDATMPDWQ